MAWKRPQERLPRRTRHSGLCTQGWNCRHTRAAVIYKSTIRRHRWTSAFGGVHFLSCSAVMQHRVAGESPAKDLPGVRPARLARAMYGGLQLAGGFPGKAETPPRGRWRRLPGHRPAFAESTPRNRQPAERPGRERGIAAPIAWSEGLSSRRRLTAHQWPGQHPGPQKPPPRGGFLHSRRIRWAPALLVPALAQPEDHPSPSLKPATMLPEPRGHQETAAREGREGREGREAKPCFKPFFAVFAPSREAVERRSVPRDDFEMAQARRVMLCFVVLRGPSW